MNCISCGGYFKQNAFNRSNECEDCLDANFLGIDSELSVDVGLLRNPSGKTSPVFYEDRDDPEMDCRDSI